MKCGEFFARLRHRQLLKKDCALWSYFVIISTSSESYSVQRVVNAASKRYVLPSYKDSMLWLKGVCPNDALTDIPHEAFPHLDTELIGTGLQVTFQTEINPWPSLVDVFITDLANTRFAEEYANEGGVVSLGPFLYWKHQRVGVVLWWVTELEVTVHGELCNKQVAYTLIFKTNKDYD
jgi:hypothetical protein